MVAAKRKRKPGSMGARESCVSFGGRERGGHLNSNSPVVPGFSVTHKKRPPKIESERGNRTTGEADWPRAGVPVLTFVFLRSEFVYRMSEPKGHQKRFRFWCGFGFDIRPDKLAAPAEANVKSTTPARRITLIRE
jgi:hypothetical protein